MSKDEVVLVRMAVAAQLLAISVSRAYLLARRGQLPGAVRLSGTWRVNRRALEEWADKAAKEAGRDAAEAAAVVRPETETAAPVSEQLGAAEPSEVRLGPAAPTD
ncbi:MAG TPA: helix-turn-helix domain-containing protein [Candidatus Eisenbacteria bacterium]|nr:helix-turn-helix domain-containing protein [Candidatus Eisenbacteria bacterium]